MGAVLTRRRLLGRGLAGLALPLGRMLPALGPRDAFGAATKPLAERFPDLRRRFLFEYYPWYGVDPFQHWQFWDRHPPADLASHYVPLLGAYDCRSAAVLEQHARWIADSGAGGVNVSWWGVGSFADGSVPLLMDVMRDHDLKVAFTLEPYRQDHGRHFADDVIHIVREYGEKRSFDALLLLQEADGRSGPVFKGFRMILPEVETDCRGVTRPVADHTSDDEWRRQLDTVRAALERDFDRVTLLADTVNAVRASGSGFDGIAVYDPFVLPEDYDAWALAATTMGLVFSFNVNPGFDKIAPRIITDPCYKPPGVLPDDSIDWSRPEERERAALLAARRIGESFDASVAAQTDPRFGNPARGFFLVYLNSFNEWHEGTALEPMKDAALLTAEERAFEYHNPQDGRSRLRVLTQRLRSVLAASPMPRREPPDTGTLTRCGTLQRAGAMRSSTVVPSLSGTGSAKATLTARTRVSVGRAGS
jgi:Glycosyl hydrolase family 99